MKALRRAGGRPQSRERAVAKHVSGVGGPDAQSGETRALHGLKALVTYTAVRISLNEMNAPSSSVETVKEHATRTGLRNGTDWLKDLLSLSSGADPYIPAAARDAITKRAHFVENGFDFEKMENIARACALHRSLPHAIFEPKGTRTAYH